MANELTLPERAKVALNSAEHEKVLVTLAKSTKDIAEIKDADGRAQVHGAYMVLKTRRSDIRKAGKDARDDATKFSKAIIAEEDRLVALIEPEEMRLQAVRDSWDQAREQERREKAAAEQRRKDGIRAKIDELRGVPLGLVDAPADKIATALDDLEAFEVTADVFAEFVDAAHAARAEVVGKLKGMHDAAVRRAEQEAELARERAEIARQREEQEAEDALIDGIWKNARRIESNTVPYIRKAIGMFESMAKDWENDPRQRVSGAIASAREEMGAKLRSAEEAAEREAEQRKLDEQKAEIARQQAAIDAERQRIADEAAARQRELAADLERAHREAAEREQAERAAQAEQQAAAMAETKRRERADFELNGPAPHEIVAVLADHFGVTHETALNWINLHAWAYVEVAA